MSLFLSCFFLVGVGLIDSSSSKLEFVIPFLVHTKHGVLCKGEVGF